MKLIHCRMVQMPYLGALLQRCFKSNDRKTPYLVSCPPTDTSRTSSANLSSRFFHVFARDGLLGVDSVYFDHVVLIRELIDTSLQSHQLYCMTLVLPRLWLIRFYVALLVINCWAVPFLHRYYRHRVTTRRMLCPMCDAVLDMLSSIGVSVVLFATYAPQYTDPNGWGFPILLYFDDEWFSNMQQEFQMMLVSSWGDMASRLVFALGLLQCVDAIKEMLTPEIPTSGKKKLQASSSSVNMIHIAPPGLVAETDDIVPLPSGEIKTAALPSGEGKAFTTGALVHPVEQKTIKTDGKETHALELTTSHHSTKSLVSRTTTFIVHVVGPGMFVLCGCVILAVHIAAEANHSTTECSLILKPWFASKPGCSLVEINCAKLESSGHDHAYDTAWNSFDPDRAARVVIRHCPELYVSSKLCLYHQMSGFKIYNSTVVVWNDDAALPQTNHARMKAVFLLHTFVPNGEPPPGLLSIEFPSQMTNFYTASTNLQSLHVDLDTKWPKAMQFLLENSRFTKIPAILIRLEPSVVSIAGSPVSVIPAELVESPFLTVLQFGLTRVQELRPIVKRIHPAFAALFVQFTNVSVFPSYLNDYAHRAIHYPANSSMHLAHPIVTNGMPSWQAHDQRSLYQRLGMNSSWMYQHLTNSLLLNARWIVRNRGCCTIIHSPLKT